MTIMKQVFVAMAAVAALFASPALASDAGAAIEDVASTLQPNGYVWGDPGNTDPVTVVVSIPQQRAFVYRGDTLVAASSVSTGKADKATPVGIYPILQKNVDHKSNLYNAAPMPFMQRLTWDGIALHAGRNPGFPASHGCVRLPAEFAKRLFEGTTVGTTVVVTDQEVGGGQLDHSLVETDAMRANAFQLSSLGN
jgi:hypothetical protein